MTSIISFCIILTILGFSLYYSLKDAHKDESSIEALDKFFYYVAVFLTFLIMVVNLNYFYINLIKIASRYFDIKTSLGLNLFKIVGLLISFFIVQFIIYRIFKILVYFLEKTLIKQSFPMFFHYIISIIFGLAKGCIILLILFLGISSYNNTFSYKGEIELFYKNDFYTLIDNYIKTNKSIILYNDIKDYIPEDSIQVFYNGVPLDYGIESDKAIDSKAVSITKNLSTDREKAKAIYAWIGANIEYDYDKANDILKGKTNYDSGARVAWRERSGICFDYACLFIAMARSVDLKVRLITGEATNGESFGPHAWNQVYLSEEERWINIDPTFYSTGDYFDSNLFMIDHRYEKISGEWK